MQNTKENTSLFNTSFNQYLSLQTINPQESLLKFLFNSEKPSENFLSTSNDQFYIDKNYENLLNNKKPDEEDYIHTMNEGLSKNEKTVFDKDTSSSQEKKEDSDTPKNNYNLILNTDNNNSPSKNPEEKEKEKNINFTKRKLGRKRKTVGFENQMPKKEHSNLDEDNLNIAFRVCLYYDFILICVNLMVKPIFFKEFLKMFDILTKNNRIDLNKMVFHSKLKNILISSPISRKYKRQPEDYNKKLIEEIYKKNGVDEIIKLLEMTIEDYYNLFIKKKNEFSEEENKIFGTKNFENVLEKKKNDKIKGFSSEFLDTFKNKCLGYREWISSNIQHRERKNNKQTEKINDFMKTLNELKEKELDQKKNEKYKK